MTRETKIGLLVGLGFIVVFAVLLSHNGSTPAQLGQLPAINNPGPQASASPDARANLLTPPLVATDVMNSQGTGLTIADVPGSEDSPESLAGTFDPGALPAPDVFKHGFAPPDDAPAVPGVPDLRNFMAATPPPDEDPSLNATRSAPMVVVDDPQPTVRSDGPTPSRSPGNEQEGSAIVALPEGGRGAATGHAVLPPARPYTIKKNDTLVSIVRAEYKVDNSSPRLIDYVVEANKDVIRDRHKIVEGTTILIPPLPPHLFEPTRAVSSVTGSDLGAVERLINPNRPGSGGRQAPEPAPERGRGKVGGARTNAPAGDAKPSKPTAPIGGVELVPLGGQQVGHTASPKAPEKIEGSATKRPSDKTAKPQPARKPASSGRWYEIQPKDTFSSIAERELGSRNRWSEIKELNKDIDPVRMKPGVRIRLPGGSGRESLSGNQGSKRVTA